MRSLAFAAAIGAMALLPTGNAGAFPIAPGASAGVESDVLQVRDGCGRGFRYSYRAGGCVRDWGGGGPPPPVYVRPAPPIYVAPPVVVRPPVIGRPACPPGMRWSNGRRACVWM
jgi:hypothetical protein